MRFTILVLAILGFYPYVGWADSPTQWYETLATVDNIRVLDLSADGNLFAGGWNNVGSSGHEYWLAKFDFDGNILWQKQYPGTNFMDAMSATPDGGAIVSGWGFWTLKLDADGNIQWQNRYGVADLSKDHCRFISTTSDGGYILTGVSMTYGGSWVIKIDADGIIQWQRVTPTGDSWGVREVTPGIYEFVGQVVSGSLGIFVGRYDSTGNLVFQKLFKTTDNHVAQALDITSDGGSLISGFPFAPLHDSILRLDSTGNVLWTKGFLGSGGASNPYWKIQETSDHNIVAAGGSSSAIKLTSDGQIIWQKKFGVTRAFAAIEAPDGDSIIAGGNDTTAIAKVNSTGLVGPECNALTDTTLTSEDLAVTIMDTSIVATETTAVPTVTTVVPFVTTAAPATVCEFSCGLSINIFPDSPLQATVGHFYNQTFSATGGTDPYTFSVSAGTLPANLTFDGPTATISGIPQQEGQNDFSIQAVDSLGCANAKDYSINVNCPAITISPGTLPGAGVGMTYSTTLSGVNGTAPYSFEISGGQLPPGLLLDTATGTIHGIATFFGTSTFTVRAHDSLGCSGVRSYSITAGCIFCDDFNNGQLSAQWTYSNTSWSEANGRLTGAGGKVTSAVASPAYGGCVLCGEETTFQVTGTKGAVWLLGWQTDKKNRVELMFKPKSGKLTLKQKSNGHVVAKSKITQTVVPGVDYAVQLSFDGTAFHLLIDGASVLDMNSNPNFTPFGTAGFQVKQNTASFENIAIY